MQLKHNCTDAARLAALAQPGAAGGHSELVLNEAQLSAISDIFHEVSWVTVHVTES
jgi:hypothetical protein